MVNRLSTPEPYSKPSKVPFLCGNLHRSGCGHLGEALFCLSAWPYYLETQAKPLAPQFSSDKPSIYENDSNES
jgi:hypothetical protein